MVPKRMARRAHPYSDRRRVRRGGRRSSDSRSGYELDLFERFGPGLRCEFDPTIAPVRKGSLDVARDARWGRVSETYGEDPYLVSAMSVAYTRGLQGNDLSKGVLATAKHFVGYAVTEGGQNMAATAVGAREARTPSVP